MSKGWVSIHRKLLDDCLWLNGSPTQKLLMITTILKANNEPKEWIWNNKKFEVDRGQFITSLSSLQESIGKGISIKNIRTALINLEKHGFLANKSAKTGRLITVLKYKEYQDSNIKKGKETGKQVAKKGQTGGKQVATTNNYNNDDNNIITAPSKLEAKINFNFTTKEWENITENNMAFWKDTYPACDIEKELKKAKGWLVGNPKKKKSNYMRFINNWLSKAQDRGGNIPSKKQYEGDYRV